MDDPLPSPLPVVAACSACNAEFSVDELYFACLLECVIKGTTEPSQLARPKIARNLSEQPALRARLKAAKGTTSDGNPIWQPEPDRVRRVITMLGRGHAAYELYSCLEEPDEVSYAPLCMLPDEARVAFERVDRGPLWPELGTRAFCRTVGKPPDRFGDAHGWIVVQPERYRYTVAEAGGVIVRIVLSEYLACSVRWELL